MIVDTMLLDFFVTEVWEPPANIVVLLDADVAQPETTAAATTMESNCACT